MFRRAIFPPGGEILREIFSRILGIWHEIGVEKVALTCVRTMDLDRHARFLAKLAELAREYDEPLRGEALVQSRLRWENWAFLRQETVAFALKEGLTAKAGRREEGRE